MAKRRFRSRGRFSRVRRRRRFRTRRFTKAVKRAIKRITEVKFSTSGATSTFDSVNGYIVDITPEIATGVTKQTRIGNRIQYKYLQIRMFLQAADGTSPTPDYITALRAILLQPRMVLDDTVTPYSFDIFTNPGIVSSFTSSIKNQNCRILMDKSFLLGTLPDCAVVQLPAAKIMKKKVRINNNVTFTGGNEVLSADPKDHYILLIVSNNPNTNAVALAVQWNARISYVDI